MIEIDLPMPEACDVCPFNYDFCWCKAFGENDNWEKYSDDWNNNVCERTTRPEYCPLKEHEAVKPILKRKWEKWENKRFNDYACPVCGNELIYEQKYCSECGKAVNWE